MIRNSLFVTCFFLLVSMSYAADEGPIRVEVLSSPQEVPLGLGSKVVDGGDMLQGWIQTEIRVRVRYIGTVDLPIVFWPFDGYHGAGFSAWAVVRDEVGRDLGPCMCPAAIDTVYSGINSLKPGWTRDYTVHVCLPGVGTYSVIAEAGNSETSVTTISGERFEMWTGISVSEPVTISVEEPIGVDKAAFEAFNGDPLNPPEGYAELLRRFPTSTYAAYLVREHSAKPLFEMKLDLALHYLNTDLSQIRGSIASGKGWRNFRGLHLLEWRNRRFRESLEAHPKIWFADEIRFVVCLDAYLLNDKAACASKLEDLSAHARPYVAEKARALLEAMRAKNMLPGGPKELGAAPAQAQPYETKDQ